MATTYNNCNEDDDDMLLVNSDDSVPLIVDSHPYSNIPQPVAAFPWQPSFQTTPQVTYVLPQQQDVQLQQYPAVVAIPETPVRKSSCRYIVFIVLAIFALLLSFPFGVSALVLAVIAYRRNMFTNRQSSASAMGFTSMGLSVAGILLSGLAILLIFIYLPVPHLLPWNVDHNMPETKQDNFIVGPSSPSCSNYLNGICYPYAVSWTSGSENCRSGVYDESSRKCYYDRKEITSSNQLCRGDVSETDNYCYYTSESLCSHARNYHNGICYPYQLEWSVTESQCPHGFYSNSVQPGGKTVCYYDSAFKGSDDTCDGFKADRGSNGWCYYSSQSACRFANNYIYGKCYEYGMAADSCSNAVRVNNICYYKNANYVGFNQMDVVFICPFMTKDYFKNGYCYFN